MEHPSITRGLTAWKEYISESVKSKHSIELARMQYIDFTSFGDNSPFVFLLFLHVLVWVITWIRVRFVNNCMNNRQGNCMSEASAIFPIANAITPK